MPKYLIDEHTLIENKRDRHDKILTGARTRLTNEASVLRKKRRKPFAQGLQNLLLVLLIKERDRTRAVLDQQVSSNCKKMVPSKVLQPE